MPARPVRFSDDAIEEARAAYEWYRERNPQAALAFAHELDAAVDGAAESPGTWPPYLNGTRRKLFTRFPFAMVYRDTGDCLEVVAVVHQRRRPGYWRDR